METTEFKKRLDSRDLWGIESQTKEIWDAAKKWADEANQEDNLIKWRWDAGLKLDYDGDVCQISSRFYPPHKAHVDYGKYSGRISVMIGDAVEYLHVHEVEADSLDELKEIVEEYVSKTLEKMHNALRAIF